MTLAPQTIWLHADLARLAQVVANHLNNAAKYTPEGGRIELTAERHDGEAIVRVRDSGIGIPAAMLPHVFGMFTQVDSARDHSQEGLGIGLTIVRNLVEMHGGTVQAASDGPGKGSEFTVRLPIAAEETPPRGAEKADGAVRKKLPPRRILVVDDNRDSADSLGALLESWGTRCARCMVAKAPWQRSASSGRIWHCWTSACRE